MKVFVTGCSAKSWEMDGNKGVTCKLYGFKAAPQTFGQGQEGFGRESIDYRAERHIVTQVSALLASANGQPVLLDLDISIGGKENQRREMITAVEEVAAPIKK